MHSWSLKVHGANIYVFLKTMRRGQPDVPLFILSRSPFLLFAFLVCLLNLLCYRKTCLNNQPNEAFAQFQEHGSKSSRSENYRAAQSAFVRIKLKKKKHHLLVSCSCCCCRGSFLCSYLCPVDDPIPISSQLLSSTNTQNVSRLSRHTGQLTTIRFKTLLI